MKLKDLDADHLYNNYKEKMLSMGFTPKTRIQFTSTVIIFIQVLNELEKSLNAK
jgi:hypothetical protein